MNKAGRSRLSKEREGCSIVGPVCDAQDAWDNGYVAAHNNVLPDPGFGKAIGKNDERGDEQQPGQTARHAKAHDVASVDCGGAMPISLRADWQRVQTFSQMP